MKLHNSGLAFVAEAKIVAYLLSDTHEEGASKAAFFKRFGFTIEAWLDLAYALRSHAAENEVTETIPATEGVKYVIEGPLPTPDGRNPRIRSVWIIDYDKTTARFITAYPIGK